jgi:hypothetical protein
MNNVDFKNAVVADVELGCLGVAKEEVELGCLGVGCEGRSGFWKLMLIMRYM